MKNVIILILFFLCLLIGCKTNELVYRKPIEGPIQTLNPKSTRMRVDFMIARAVFGQLLTYDSLGNIQPGIFRSWQVSDDGKTYIFNIDPKITFHDGMPVTIEDVIFSFQYLAFKDSLVSRYFENIIGFEDFFSGKKNVLSGLRKTTDSQLEIKLKNKSFIFLAQLADPKIVLLPLNLRGLKEPDFFDHPIEAGSYKLKSMNAEKTHLVLERFDNFWGQKSNIKFFDLMVF